MQKEAIAPSSPTAARRPRFAIALLCIAALALIIFGMRLATAVHSPFFGGDAGHRLHMARLPIVRIGNRTWLPMLQVHIWVFYLLHLPYYVFKIIPCFYFFVALFFLGIFTWRRSVESYGGLLFTLFLMFCFGYQAEILGLSMQLYQESLELACFFVLLWGGAVELPGNLSGTIRVASTPPVAPGRLGVSSPSEAGSGAVPLSMNKWLPIAGAAMLTREPFWIYLFTISLLNWREILSRKDYRRSFLLLWSIPVLWLLSTPFIYRRYVGRYPSFPTEWPLGINKEGNRAVAHLSTSLSNLFTSLVYSRVTYLVAGLIVVWVIGRVVGKTEERRAKLDIFESRFPPFSFLSLGIIYALIILFDPWEYTSGSGRLAIPLIAQGFVWAGLLFAETYSYPSPAKVLARGVLVAALVLSMNLDVSTWIPKIGSPEERSVAEIAQLVQAAGGDRKAIVCIPVQEDYWQVAARFAAPTLYAMWSPQPDADAISGACDVIIKSTGSNAIVPGVEYTKYRDYALTGESSALRSYSVFKRAGRSQGSP